MERALSCEPASAPRPKRPYRLYAGTDALAVDLVATRHMGLSNPRDSSVLDAACHWFGDPSETIEVVGTDEPIDGWRSPYHNELTSLLSLIANPVYRFASHRGESFLPPMDEKAFPFRPGACARPLVRAQRWLLHKLLRMELPRR